ncbi:30S ribosome-binding factor RbfA [Acanthopleuribacter pedis]|uniref:Ribosome-binding factor A n=1 Tax=Acanthopleuribacter pedis TaxID=442870 RepID=A0A8J7QEN0_9BACT|nr:30S ribosome-binding factor RbfA [Acanthopleuribacter pedis]MBO1316960.1 30S ribosome-binding factor RbfA [Acanthopleuribacter pedis]
MSTHRLNNLAEQVRQVLSYALSFEMRDPGFDGVTITRVRLSPDLQFADVLFTELDDDTNPEVPIESFRRAKGALKRIVAQRVQMRRVPELRFHVDEDVVAERRIGKILETMHQNDDQADATDAASGETQE